MPWRSLVLLLLAGACGPSASEIRRSQNVVYATEFPVVWNVVVEEVRRKYSEIADENPIAGTIRTNWRMVQNRQDEQSQASGPPANSQQPTQSGGQAAAARSQVQIPGGVFMRVEVIVKGPPWRVTVNGEAAEYSPGNAMLVPLRRGYADEPAWLEPRTQALRFAIYERLKKYSIDDIPVNTVKKKNDSSPWSKIDPAAAQLIADVRAAARAKDTTALEELMDPEFTWAPGAEPSATTALAMFGADPERLAALVKTLDAGCAADAKAAAIFCPAATRAGEARAQFKKQPGGWRFTSFVMP